MKALKPYENQTGRRGHPREILGTGRSVSKAEPQANIKAAILDRRLFFFCGFPA